MKQKLQHLMELTKPYSMEGFILFKDHEGWTDGFMADLTNLRQEEMKATATIKNAKNPRNFRFTVELDRCPEFSKLPAGGDQEVIDMELDLTDGYTWLLSEEDQTKVNQKYLKYFEETYKKLGGISKLLIDGQKPIQVFNGDQKVGIIMPIRV